jgi:flagellar protein FlaG
MNITPTNSAPQQSQSTLLKAPAPPAVSSGPVLTQAADAEPAAAKVKLQAVEKVDLGFSANEMRENIHESIERLNQQLKANGRHLSFQMDEKIDRPIITVRNLETGEVVRQIPTEEIVRMAHSLEDIKGLIFNESL